MTADRTAGSAAVSKVVRWQSRRRIEGIFFAEPYTFVINRDKFRTAYKLLRIEKVDFFLNFHKNVKF